MEAIAVLGIVIFIVAVLAYYGIFTSVETGARMANRRVERLEAEQIREDIEYYNENSIKDADFKSAVKQKQEIAKYRSL